MEQKHKYKSSDQLCEEISRLSDSTCLLAFSTGKDAISAWLKCKRHFKKIIPIYYYGIPNLAFVERSLAYYEEFFQTKIIRVPVPNLYWHLNSGMFQTQRTWKIIQHYKFPQVDREDMVKWIKGDLGLPESTYIAIGNRQFDNTHRMRLIMTYGPVNHKARTFYPVYDYKIADVVTELQAAKIKLPIDYKIFGKSFDGFDYRFIKGIKQHFPADYEKIKEFFPLIDTEIIRYESL